MRNEILTRFKTMSMMASTEASIEIMDNLRALTVGADWRVYTDMLVGDDTAYGIVMLFALNEEANHISTCEHCSTPVKFITRSAIAEAVERAVAQTVPQMEDRLSIETHVIMIPRYSEGMIAKKCQTVSTKLREIQSTLVTRHDGSVN